MAYPKKLLDNISWAFNTSQMDLNEFNNALKEYNAYLGAKIDPSEIILNVSKIIIVYTYEENLNENTFIFELDCDGSFYCGELLYKIQKKIISYIINSDYIFFEGLEIDELKTFKSKTPTYTLKMGS